MTRLTVLFCRILTVSDLPAHFCSTGCCSSISRFILLWDLLHLLFRSILIRSSIFILVFIFIVVVMTIGRVELIV